MFNAKILTKVKQPLPGSIPFGFEQVAGDYVIVLGKASHGCLKCV